MKIEDILNATGLSKAALARELGIPYRTIQDWAAGLREPPQYVIDLIAEHYGLK